MGWRSVKAHRKLNSALFFVDVIKFGATATGKDDKAFNYLLASNEKRSKEWS